MFTETPEARRPQSGDPVADTLREMDKYNIEIAVFNLSGVACTETEMAAIKHPAKRLRPVLSVDPNRGMDAVREIARAHGELGIVGVSLFPVGYVPPVPINDKRMYPIYTKCNELDIAVFCTSGVPGPRLPFDAVHGLSTKCAGSSRSCVSFCDTAASRGPICVQLLLKWPNLLQHHAFAPKYERIARVREHAVQTRSSTPDTIRSA
jgi:predicted TIM-barrel fold metal-dependent hydrolase